MVKPGVVVTALFAGATGTKRRPSVVVSSDLYHAHRPDLILALLTTNTSAATGPTDHVLQD
jgi:mRNA interferase MazF